MIFLKQLIAAFACFLILDFVWLGYVVKVFNLKQLAEIGRIKNSQFDVLYAPALLVYLFMALMLIYFVLPRLEADASLPEIFIIGAIAGLLTYGIFDMTNLAILKGYPLMFALVDMAWGTFLFGAVAVAVKKLV